VCPDWLVLAPEVDQELRNRFVEERSTSGVAKDRSV
jgi:hypothetical protein